MCQPFKTVLLTCRAGTDVHIINATSCQHYVKVQYTSFYAIGFRANRLYMGYCYHGAHYISCHGYCGVCDPSPLQCKFCSKVRFSIFTKMTGTDDAKIHSVHSHWQTFTLQTHPNEFLVVWHSIL